jgi:hypothetical protein
MKDGAPSPLGTATTWCRRRPAAPSHSQHAGLPFAPSWAGSRGLRALPVDVPAPALLGSEDGDWIALVTSSLSRMIRSNCGWTSPNSPRSRRRTIRPRPRWPGAGCRPRATSDGRAVGARTTRRPCRGPFTRRQAAHEPRSTSQSRHPGDIRSDASSSSNLSDTNLLWTSAAGRMCRPSPRFPARRRHAGRTRPVRRW